MVNTCTSTAANRNRTVIREPYIIRSLPRNSSPAANRFTNRFEILANPSPLDDHNDAAMPASKGRALGQQARNPRHKKKLPSRWRSKHPDKPSDAVAFADSDVRLPSDRPAHNGPSFPFEEQDPESADAPESYEPHLGVMLPGDITLDSIPRPSPPFVVRVKPRAVSKRDQHVAMDDWDVVSNASEESFCMV